MPGRRNRRLGRLPPQRHQCGTAEGTQSRSGSLKNVLVLVADCRLGMPNGANEMAFGDGAAAMLIGSDGVLASIDSMHTMADEIIDVFRSDRDRFVHAWETRFIRDYGHGRVMPQAMKAAAEKAGVALADFARVIMYSRISAIFRRPRR